MIGAIIGDVVGSVYEFSSHKRKRFPLFTRGCHLTDDSLMTIAVGCACAQSYGQSQADFEAAVIHWMRHIGCRYPNAGYGEQFYQWLHSPTPVPYNSFGNGSAMRVSPVAWYAGSLEEAERLAEWSARVTHSHPQGIKGAKAVAAAIYMARTGGSKEEIRAYITRNYYPLNKTLAEIRPSYHFDVTCQGSVPQAILCFLEAEDLEDAVRNAISLGGDGDTQAAIAGSIAEAFFGVPEALAATALTYMDKRVRRCFDKYGQTLYSGAAWLGGA